MIYKHLSSIPRFGPSTVDLLINEVVSLLDFRIAVDWLFSAKRKSVRYGDIEHQDSYIDIVPRTPMYIAQLFHSHDLSRRDCSKVRSRNFTILEDNLQ